MGHAKGEGKEVPLHRYPQLSRLRSRVGKDRERDRRHTQAVLWWRRMPVIPVLNSQQSNGHEAGSSTKQAKHRAGEEATAQGQGRSSLYRTEQFKEIHGFSVCVLVQTPCFLSLCLREYRTLPTLA